MEKEYVELVMWETVRNDLKLPIEDNNDGFIYGLYLIDFEGEGDIIDTQWFKDVQERDDFISQNSFLILHD
jgi:hypothetical protein